jgi:hypothetical protein
MKNKDPILWAVRQLHGVLGRTHRSTEANMHEPLNAVLAYKDLFQQSLSRMRKAQHHGWLAAAGLCTERLFECATHLRNNLDRLLRVKTQPQSPAVPTWGFLLDELRQLQQEFGNLVINPKCGQIAVTTDPIRLEGRYLGPFRIELYIDRLSDRMGSGAFDCVATDPHPAAGNEETTHPHVKSNNLCAGEATVPIQAALRQGRIADAFSLINSVLNTYNPGSPYVSLDDWEGIACGDCGATTDRDELFSCDACESVICEHCISSCEACDQSVCQACLQRESRGKRYLCPACRTECSRCGGTVAESDVDEAGLCPQCQEEDREAQDQKENEHEHCQHNHEQHKHEGQQPDEVQLAAPAPAAG